MNRLSLILAGVATLATLGACVPPKILVTNSFLGDNKVSKFHIQQSGKVAQKQALYNFSLRICDLAQDGSQANCKDTTVLQDVFPQSIY